MKKSIKYWDKYTVYGFVFDGTADLCNYVRTAPLNIKVFPLQTIKGEGSQGSDLTVHGGGWYQTKDFKEALQMYEDGWHEDYDFFRSLGKRLEKRTDKLQLIPNDKSKPINIFVNLCYRWETPSKAIINRGVIIQNLIRVLEKNGYKVNLKTFALSYCENELSCIVINLKNVNEELDPRRAYFAFCNPSFLRRIVFRVMESSDFKELGWRNSYGTVCQADFIKKAFNTTKSDIIIPAAWDMGIYGENIDKDWQQFLQYENLEDFF